MPTCTAPTPATVIDPTRDPVWTRDPGYLEPFEYGCLWRQDLVETLRGELLPYGEPDYGRVGEMCEG